MNVDISMLTPGVFGVSHGGGIAGEIIRSATGSWAGHAFGFVGGNQLVEGRPPVAALASAESYSDALWAWKMWSQLIAEENWTPAQVLIAQGVVAARYRKLVGDSYDYVAYLGFELEVLHLRTEQQLAPEYAHDGYRVCSALVADALTCGGVPLNFVPEDGPGLIGRSGSVKLPPNLVAPGMLLGLAQRLEWI